MSIGHVGVPGLSWAVAIFAQGAGGGAAGGGGAGVDAPADIVAMDATVEVAPEVQGGPFALTSPAFSEGMEIPVMYKCAQSGNTPVGMNASPPLDWTRGRRGR